MNEDTCPWCEAALVLHIVAASQTCSECGTTWSYEDEPDTQELALAA